LAVHPGSVVAGLRPGLLTGAAQCLHLGEWVSAGAGAGAKGTLVLEPTSGTRPKGVLVAEPTSGTTQRHTWLQSQPVAPGSSTRGGADDHQSGLVTVYVTRAEKRDMALCQSLEPTLR
jgi:hypothetical protein